MLKVPRALVLLGLVLVIALAVFAVRRGDAPAADRRPGLAAANRPLDLTSDTLAYCESLRERVSTLLRRVNGTPPAEVTRLRVEGQRMCKDGEVRGGVLRLRGAVLLLMHETGTPP